MLTAKHILHLSLGQALRKVVHPVGKLEEHLPGILPSALKVSVPEPGESLVDIVQRHPPVIQPECSGANVSAAYFFPHLGTVRHSAQVAVSGGILAEFPLFQHIIKTTSYLFVTGSGIHICKR